MLNHIIYKTQIFKEVPEANMGEFLINLDQGGHFSV